MTPAERRVLEDERDRALHDIVGLDRQQRDGEIPTEKAEQLRRHYEHRAAAALAGLRATAEPIVSGDPRSEHGDSRPPRRWAGAARLAYAVAAAAAVFALAVLLPLYTGARPPGGAVSGNEAISGPSGPAAGVPGSDVAALQAAVAANPGAVGVRLMLADRYAADGTYDQAVREYLIATRLAPDNAEAAAHFAALLLQVGQPVPALDYINRALAVDPALLDAQWIKAAIELDGLGQPRAALATLDRIRRRSDLSAPTRDQLERLASTARDRQPGAR